MNCERAMQSFVASLAGEPTTHRDAGLDEHLATCDRCREASNQMTAMWANVGAVPEVPPPARLRAQFDAMLARAVAAERRAPAPGRAGSDWMARLAAGFAAWRPASLATAVAGIAAGFVIGHQMASRGGEMSALRQELKSTRSMMALSLLQQRSPVERLRGVGYSAQVDAPNPEIVAALFMTLEEDSNVDVRLAAVDALAGLGDVEGVRKRLLESLRTQPSPLVQIAIIDALVRLRDADAQPMLRSLADDAAANSTVRERARWAVQQLTL